MNLHDDFELNAAAAARFLDEAHTDPTQLPSAACSDELGGPRASLALVAMSAATTAPALAHWQLSVRFGTDALRNAVSPLDWVRKLPRWGRVLAIHTLVDAVPPLAQLDPEACCLGFEIRFESQASHGAVAGMLALQTADGEIAVLALWREQGLVLPLRDADPALDTADDPELAGAQDSGPQIERRVAERAAGRVRPQIG